MFIYYSYYIRFGLVCLLLSAGQKLIGSMLSLSVLESEHKPVQLICNNGKKLSVAYEIVCLSDVLRQQLPSHTGEQHIKLDVTQELAYKLVTLVHHAYTAHKQKPTNAQNTAAAEFSYITLEDMVHLMQALDTLRFPATLKNSCMTVCAEKLIHDTLLTQCAADIQCVESIVTLLSEEYLESLINYLLAQYGYLLWGVLQDFASVYTEPLVLPADYVAAEIVQLHLQRMSVRVTHDQHSLYIGIYDIKDIKKHVLLATLTGSNVRSQESIQQILVSPDMLTITLITRNPEADKAQLLVGEQASALVQLFDIAGVIKLLSYKEILFLLICEYAHVHNKVLDKSYIDYFRNDHFSFLRKAIMRYSVGSNSFSRRCTVS